MRGLHQLCSKLLDSLCALDFQRWGLCTVATWMYSPVLDPGISPALGQGEFEVLYF